LFLVKCGLNMLNLAYFQTRSSSGKIPKVRNTAAGSEMDVTYEKDEASGI